MTHGDGLVEEAVDNDVLLKAIRLDCVATFWQSLATIGVLGAARFVVRGRITRDTLAESDPSIEDRLVELFDGVSELEPTSDEFDLASALEREAQRQALPLDAGESQLCAMAATRGIALFTTGDKRAIESLEVMRAAAGWLDKLAGRIRCFEQLVIASIDGDAMCSELRSRVCADVGVDKTLAICFRCLGGSSPPSTSDVLSCFDSYINAVRESARTLLVAGS